MGSMKSSTLVIVTNVSAVAKAYWAPGGKVLETDEDKLYFWNSCW